MNNLLSTVPIGLLFISLMVLISCLAWIVIKTTKQEMYNPNDKRPLILYLREFTSDYSVHEMAKISYLPQELYTHEFQLMQDYRLNIIGQFVSVGDPKINVVTTYNYDGTIAHRSVSRKKFGAKLIFLQGKVNWKEKVLGLMQKSSMIIIRPGFSEAINWELEQLSKMDLLRKTIIFSNMGTGNLKVEELAYYFFKDNVGHYLKNLPSFSNKLKFIYLMKILLQMEHQYFLQLLYLKTYINNFSQLRDIPILKKV